MGNIINLDDLNFLCNLRITPDHLNSIVYYIQQLRNYVEGLSVSETPLVNLDGYLKISDLNSKLPLNLVYNQSNGSKYYIYSNNAISGAKVGNTYKDFLFVGDTIDGNTKININGNSTKTLSDYLSNIPQTQTDIVSTLIGNNGILSNNYSNYATLGKYLKIHSSWISNDSNGGTSGNNNTGSINSWWGKTADSSGNVTGSLRGGIEFIEFHKIVDGKDIYIRLGIDVTNNALYLYRVDSNGNVIEGDANFYATEVISNGTISSVDTETPGEIGGGTEGGGGGSETDTPVISYQILNKRRYDNAIGRTYEGSEFYNPDGTIIFYPVVYGKNYDYQYLQANMHIPFDIYRSARLKLMKDLENNKNILEVERNIAISTMKEKSLDNVEPGIYLGNNYYFETKTYVKQSNYDILCYLANENYSFVSTDTTYFSTAWTEQQIGLKNSILVENVPTLYQIFNDPDLYSGQFTKIENLYYENYEVNTGKFKGGTKEIRNSNLSEDDVSSYYEDKVQFYNTPLANDHVNLNRLNDGLVLRTELLYGGSKCKNISKFYDSEGKPLELAISNELGDIVTTKYVYEEYIPVAIPREFNYGLICGVIKKGVNWSWSDFKSNPKTYIENALLNDYHPQQRFLWQMDNKHLIELLLLHFLSGVDLTNCNFSFFNPDSDAFGNTSVNSSAKTAKVINEEFENFIKENVPYYKWIFDTYWDITKLNYNLDTITANIFNVNLTCILKLIISLIIECILDLFGPKMPWEDEESDLFSGSWKTEGYYKSFGLDSILWMLANGIALNPWIKREKTDIFYDYVKGDNPVIKIDFDDDSWDNYLNISKSMLEDRTFKFKGSNWTADSEIDTIKGRITSSNKSIIRNIIKFPLLKILSDHLVIDSATIGVRKNVYNNQIEGLNPIPTGAYGSAEYSGATHVDSDEWNKIINSANGGTNSDDYRDNRGPLRTPWTTRVFHRFIYYVEPGSDKNDRSSYKIIYGVYTNNGTEYFIVPTTNDYNYFNVTENGITTNVENTYMWGYISTGWEHRIRYLGLIYGLFNNDGEYTGTADTNLPSNTPIILKISKELIEQNGYLILELNINSESDSTTGLTQSGNTSFNSAEKFLGRYGNNNHNYTRETVNSNVWTTSTDETFAYKKFVKHDYSGYAQLDNLTYGYSGGVLPGGLWHNYNTYDSNNGRDEYETLPTGLTSFNQYMSEKNYIQILADLHPTNDGYFGIDEVGYVFIIDDSTPHTLGDPDCKYTRHSDQYEVCDGLIYSDNVWSDVYYNEAPYKNYARVSLEKAAYPFVTKIVKLMNNVDISASTNPDLENHIISQYHKFLFHLKKLSVLYSEFSGEPFNETLFDGQIASKPLYIYLNSKRRYNILKSTQHPPIRLNKIYGLSSSVVDENYNNLEDTYYQYLDLANNGYLEGPYNEGLGSYIRHYFERTGVVNYNDTSWVRYVWNNKSDDEECDIPKGTYYYDVTGNVPDNHAIGAWVAFDKITDHPAMRLEQDDIFVLIHSKNYIDNNLEFIVSFSNDSKIQEHRESAMGKLIDLHEGGDTSDIDGVNNVELSSGFGTSSSISGETVHGSLRPELIRNLDYELGAEISDNWFTSKEITIDMLDEINIDNRFSGYDLVSNISSGIYKRYGGSGYYVSAFKVNNPIVITSILPSRFFEYDSLAFLYNNNAQVNFFGRTFLVGVR